MLARHSLTALRAFKNAGGGAAKVTGGKGDPREGSTSKLFTLKVNERNNRWRVVKPKQTEQDRELGRKWNDKMWEWERRTQLEFRQKLFLKMEAIDALPTELREHVFTVDWSPLPEGFSSIRSPWPHWIEDAANEI